jgi:DNA-binding MarR family transcriptional regulator
MPEGGKVSSGATHRRIDLESVELIMRSAQVFAALTAESIARVGDSVTPSQLRVLVLADTVGSLNNKGVAAALNVDVSNASRICDRLVQTGLLNRRDSPTDRRNVELSLTSRGRELVSAVMKHRQAALTDILQRMPARSRQALLSSLEDFNAAAQSRVGDPDHSRWP